jgi:hypothetical protein
MPRPLLCEFEKSAAVFTTSYELMIGKVPSLKLAIKANLLSVWKGKQLREESLKGRRERRGDGEHKHEEQMRLVDHACACWMYVRLSPC